jgi:prepilin-type N-terminal cleavage/methylation domain-containing protein
MHPDRPDRLAGFSLIELLVATVAASILALTASTMLILAWKSWGTLQEGIEMQRDASTTLIAMKHKLQGAAEEDVAITNLNGRLHLQIENASFYPQGSDLIYDPDTGVSGNEMKMITGRLDAFTPSSTNRAGRVSVSIGLSLFGDIGHETISLTSTVALRN